MRFALFALLLALSMTGCSRTPGPGDSARHDDRVALPPMLAPSTSTSTSTTKDGSYMGRVIAAPMSYRGADWLERSDREVTQKPDYMLDSLGIREGQTIADVGCGSGYFTTRLAKRVGVGGRVIATDLQPEMLALLAKKIEGAKITNVVPKLATAEDARLPSGELDLVLMVDVYHELPNPPATLAQIKRALRPKGRLALVEYRAEDPKVAIKPEHKTTLAQLKTELEANSFVFVSSDESLPEQRIVIFEAAR